MLKGMARSVLFLLVINAAVLCSFVFGSYSASKVERHLDELPGKYHNRMYGYNASAPGAHKKAWMVLETVNGLKNEDVVMLVTSTSQKKFAYLRERIIQSSRTWMRMLANVFVSVEDTYSVRFALRFCAISETTHFTTFSCHNEPTYVLSRKCTNEYYGGPGPCCKVDDLFTYLMVDRPDLFAHTKYALHCDDDTYWRVDQVLVWLAAIENSGMNTFPIIANGNMNDPKENVWHIKGCKEIHTNGWYQPMVLNHAALERMKVASSSYGLAETCKNFEVTHDVGMGPYAWLFGLYHLPIPHLTVHNAGGKDQLDPEFMIVHAMKHGSAADNCQYTFTFNLTQRYKQNVVEGCGDIDEPQQGHTRAKGHKGEALVADMYDGWNFYKEHGKKVPIGFHGVDYFVKRKVTVYPNGTMLPGISTTGDEYKLKVKKVLKDTDVVTPQGTFEGDEVRELDIPVLQQLRGYEDTKHSKKYNILKEWHPFKLSDCKEKGKVVT